jgi:hypothetical protein
MGRHSEIGLHAVHTNPAFSRPGTAAQEQVKRTNQQADDGR